MSVNNMKLEAVPCILNKGDGQPVYGLLVRPLGQDSAQVTTTTLPDPGGNERPGSSRRPGSSNSVPADPVPTPQTTFMSIAPAPPPGVMVQARPANTAAYWQIQPSNATMVSMSGGTGEPLGGSATQTMFQTTTFQPSLQQQPQTSANGNNLSHQQQQHSMSNCLPIAPSGGLALAASQPVASRFSTPCAIAPQPPAMGGGVGQAIVPSGYSSQVYSQQNPIFIPATPVQGYQSQIQITGTGTAGTGTDNLVHVAPRPNQSAQQHPVIPFDPNPGGSSGLGVGVIPSSSNTGSVGNQSAQVIINTYQQQQQQAYCANTSRQQNSGDSQQLGFHGASAPTPGTSHLPDPYSSYTPQLQQVGYLAQQESSTSSSQIPYYQQQDIQNCRRTSTYQMSPVAFNDGYQHHQNQAQQLQNDHSQGGMGEMSGEDLPFLHDLNMYFSTNEDGSGSVSMDASGMMHPQVSTRGHASPMKLSHHQHHSDGFLASPEPTAGSVVTSSNDSYASDAFMPNVDMLHQQSVPSCSQPQSERSKFGRGGYYEEPETERQRYSLRNSANRAPPPVVNTGATHCDYHDPKPCSSTQIQYSSPSSVPDFHPVISATSNTGYCSVDVGDHMHSPQIAPLPSNMVVSLSHAGAMVVAPPQQISPLGGSPDSGIQSVGGSPAQASPFSHATAQPLAAPHQYHPPLPSHELPVASAPKSARRRRERPKNPKKQIQAQFSDMPKLKRESVKRTGSKQAMESSSDYGDAMDQSDAETDSLLLKVEVEEFVKTFASKLESKFVAVISKSGREQQATLVESQSSIATDVDQCPPVLDAEMAGDDVDQAATIIPSTSSLSNEVSNATGTEDSDVLLSAIKSLPASKLHHFLELVNNHKSGSSKDLSHISSMMSQQAGYTSDDASSVSSVHSDSKKLITAAVTPVPPSASTMSRSKKVEMLERLERYRASKSTASTVLSPTAKLELLVAKLNRLYSPVDTEVERRKRSNVDFLDLQYIRQILQHASQRESTHWVFVAQRQESAMDSAASTSAQPMDLSDQALNDAGLFTIAPRLSGTPRGGVEEKRRKGKSRRREREQEQQSLVKNSDSVSEPKSADSITPTANPSIQPESRSSRSSTASPELGSQSSSDTRARIKNDKSKNESVGRDTKEFFVVASDNSSRDSDSVCSATENPKISLKICLKQSMSSPSVSELVCDKESPSSPAGALPLKKRRKRSILESDGDRVHPKNTPAAAPDAHDVIMRSLSTIESNSGASSSMSSKVLLKRVPPEKLLAKAAKHDSERCKDQPCSSTSTKDDTPLKTSKKRKYKRNVNPWDRPRSRQKHSALPSGHHMERCPACGSQFLVKDEETKRPKVEVLYCSQCRKLPISQRHLRMKRKQLNKRHQKKVFGGSKQQAEPCKLILRRKADPDYVHNSFRVSVKKESVTAEVWSTSATYRPEVSSNLVPKKKFCKAGKIAPMLSGDDLSSKSGDKPSVFGPLQCSLLNTGAIRIEDFLLKYDIWWQMMHEKKQKSKSANDGIEVYQKINTNVHLSDNSLRKPKTNHDDNRCLCKVSDPCTDISCLNRAVYTECSADLCPCGERCENQRLQRRKWSKSLVKFRVPGKGIGVKTKEAIQTDALICEYVGEVVSADVFWYRMSNWYHNADHHYALNLDGNRVIDAYRYGCIGRFLNHSCEPNCEVQKWTAAGDAHCGIFALRNIEPNEELTYNYNFHFFHAETSQKCHCGAKSCSGVIGGGKVIQYSPNGPTTRTKRKRRWLGRMKEESGYLMRLNPVRRVELLKTSRPLSYRERNLIAKGRLFMLRTHDRIRSNGQQYGASVTDNDPSEEKRAELIQSHLVAIRTGRLGGTRGVAFAEKDEFLTKFAGLTQLLKFTCDSLRKYGNDISCSNLNLTSVQQKIDDMVYTHPREFHEDASLLVTRLVDSQLSAYFNDVLLPELVQNCSSFCSFDANWLPKREVGNSGDAKVEPTIDFNTIDFSVTEKAAASSENRSDKCYLDELIDTVTNVDNQDGIWPSVATGESPALDKVLCRCGIFEEEGEIIQCDKCLYWQHSLCVPLEISQKDPYYCERCLADGSLSLTADVVLWEQPEVRCIACRYYRSLCNQWMQVRVHEAVYVLTDIGDKLKKVCKAFHDGQKTLGEGTPAPPLIAYQKNISLTRSLKSPFTQRFRKSEVRPFRVERLFSASDGERYVFGYYYARPSETFCEPKRRFNRNELFQTPIYDTLPLEVVVGRCCIYETPQYCKGRVRYPKYAESDVYFFEFKLDKLQRSFEKLSKPKKSRKRTTSTAEVASSREFLFQKFVDRLKIRRDFTPFKTCETKIAGGGSVAKVVAQNSAKSSSSTPKVHRNDPKLISSSKKRKMSMSGGAVHARKKSNFANSSGEGRNRSEFDRKQRHLSSLVDGKLAVKNVDES